MPDDVWSGERGHSSHLNAEFVVAKHRYPLATSLQAIDLERPGPRP
jgi:hypothetical protein